MILKRLILSSFAALSMMSMMAAPAKPGLHTVTQPDGTKIEVRLVGDEFFNSYVTTDGLAVSMQPDGYFYYNSADGVTSMRASSPSMRGEAEKAFIEAGGEKLTLASLIEKKSSSVAAMRKGARAPMKATQVPNNGSPNVPIILVQYQDVKFKDPDPKAVFEDFFNKGEKSAYRYFVDQSNGKYTPNFDVYGPVTLSEKRVVYGGNNSFGTDQGVGKMVAEGCFSLKDQIDFSKYDNNGDGECDVVIVLYAGVGANSSAAPNSAEAIWPMQWSLQGSDYATTMRLNGTVINKFAVFNELDGTNLDEIDGIGTFCHEYSHCLGLPDFYDTNYNGHFGMYVWSCLDSGCYNDDGHTPVGYTAYEKSFMNWIDLEEAYEDTFYTLDPFNKGDDRAIKITNDADPNEYYVIENRRRQGWDEFLPAEGLLITHVTYSEDAWNRNYVNDYDMQRMTLIPADGTLKQDELKVNGLIYYVANEEDLKGDLWPFGDSNELTDTSTPAATVNRGGFMSKPVTEITDNGDGTVSFWIMKGFTPTLRTPLLEEHQAADATGFTACWTPGDSNSDLTYTLEVMEYKEPFKELLHTTDFTKNNHGWEVTGFSKLEEGATRVGSASSNGALTSEVFNSGDIEEVTVIANAKSYGKDNSKFKVSLVDVSGNELSSTDYLLTESFADYSLLLNVAKNTDYRVRIETLEVKQRFYIAKADIYSGNAVPRHRVAASETGDETYRLITGITDTSYTVTGLKENTEYEYRVKAVPNDPDAFHESKWTDKKAIVLGNGSGVTITVDTDAPVEYFTLQGMRVDNATLQPGIYICRKGGKSYKVLVK